MAGFDDSEAELLSEGEFADQGGFDDPDVDQFVAVAAQHADSFLEDVCELEEDLAVFVGAGSTEDVDSAVSSPELPVSSDDAGASSASTVASRTGHVPMSPAPTVLDSPDSQSPSSNFGVVREQAPAMSTSVSPSLPARFRRVRIKAKTAGNNYYKQEAEEKVVGMIARFLRDPAFHMYRKCEPNMRRYVNKRFSMAKARFVERLRRDKEFPLGGGKVIKVHPSVDGKLQLSGNIQTWLEHAAQDHTLKPLDRGCFINNALLAKSHKTVLPMHGFQKLNSLSVLLTWQGDWGTCSLESLGLRAPVGLGEVMIKITDRDWLQSLWAEFRCQVRTWSDAYSLSEWAISAEMCTRSLALQNVVRVHLHAWVMLPQMRRTTCALLLNDFMFMDSVPHNSNFRMQHTRGGGAKFAGSFYVSVSKIGSLFSTSTKEMFADYPVSPAWITSLLAARKLDWDTAEHLYVQSVQNVEHNLKGVQIMKQYHKLQEIKEKRLRLERVIRGSQRPFKRIEDVEVWDRQYDEVKDRYKFLVLDGKSRTGKSRFAANRTSPEKFLNVDCSSATEPDLRCFDRDKHEVVLFDEGSPDLVLRVKKLAQASIDEVRLGQSATNINSYVVWFHRVKLIVASNVWAASVKHCTPEDQEWLAANSVYVWVDGPLHE